MVTELLFMFEGYFNWAICLDKAYETANFVLAPMIVKRRALTKLTPIAHQQQYQDIIIWIGQLQFHMILQQNYIKIAQYSQKAFEIYCRRSLGIAIIKLLQKKKAKQKQKHYEQLSEDVQNGLGKRMVSEKNLQPHIDDSFERDSAYSEIRKTQNHQKNDGGIKMGSVCERMQLKYGDLIYIEYSCIKIKSYLNKFKLCDQQTSSASHDFRCIFQIVCPNPQTLDESQPLQEHHRFCLKSISNQRYLQASDKVCSSDEFFKEVKLSKKMGQNCIFEFELEQNDEDDDREGIITGQSIFIKQFSKNMYLSVDIEQSEIGFSYASCPFKIKKLCMALDDVIPKYYRIYHPKFKKYVEAAAVQFQCVSLKKVYTTAIALTENGQKIKMPPFTYTTIDFSKAPEEQLRIVNQSDKSLLGCWELSKFVSKTGNQIIKTVSSITGMGISIKNRIVPKLTPKFQQFADLKVNESNHNTFLFALDSHTNQLQVCYDRENQKYYACFAKSDAYSTSKKFKIQKVCEKTTKIICMLSEVFEVLQEHLYFYESWGNQLQVKSEVLYYSVKKIKLGSSQMLKRKKEINYIEGKFKKILQDPSFSEKDICQTSNSMKIFELLIHISRVIWQKIGLGIRIDRENINSPFCVAKENLEEILMILLSMILRLTKDNTANSSVVISEVNFFNKILIEYPEKIGQILQQAIKNLSIFSTKSSLTQCNELFLWVQLIQPIRETTVTIQKTYIDIIAEVVVDPNDEGIVSYQNKCKQLLFIQKSSKRIGIPRFGVDTESGRPIVVFQNQNFMNQFLTNNRAVSKLNLVKFSCASYFIEDFFCDHYSFNSEIYNAYISYIISVIKLFGNLCKGRNKKLIKVVSDWGITQEHIMSVFESKKITWILKAHYMSLWISVFADQEPLLSFSKRQSKCHFWRKISKYNLFDCTAVIFKQYTDQNLLFQKLHDFRNKFLPIISSFFISFKKKMPEILYDKSDLQCLLLILNSLTVLINFGYLSIRDMKDYVGVILQILVPYDPQRNRNKISDEQVENFHNKITTAILNILQIYEQIWVELYGIDFLKNFHKNFEFKEFIRTKTQLKQWWKSALRSQLSDERPEQPRTNVRKKTRVHLSQNQYYTITDRSSIVYTLNFKDNYAEVENQSQQYLLNLLANRKFQQKSSTYGKILGILQKKMKRYERICNYLNQSIILNTREEEQIYNDFSGRQPGRLLNWLKINELVLKLKEYQHGKGEDQFSKHRKEKYLQLTNILIKVIRQIRHYRLQNRGLLVKCQFILVKLNVHTILLEMLALTEKDYEETVKTLYQFFDELMFGNPIIYKMLSPHIQKFTKHLHNDKIVKILPTLIQYSPNKQSAFWVVRQLIPHIQTSHSGHYLLEAISNIILANPYCKQTQCLRLKINDHIMSNIDSLCCLSQQKVSFSYIKLVCLISHQSPDLQQKLLIIYPKTSLLAELYKNNSYEMKKILLKLLLEVHLRKNKLQNFEIEDYVLNIAQKQILTIPNVFIKLIDRRTLSREIEDSLNRLYDEAILDRFTIPTGIEEPYLDYVLDHHNYEEVSILKFLQKIIIKWEGRYLSQRLTQTLKLMEKVQQVIRIILNQKNTPYHRKILQRIERVNSLLKNIVDIEQYLVPQYILGADEKKHIITFFKAFAKYLRKQKISFQILLECFQVNQQVFLSKRQGGNISMYVTSEEFILFMNKLKPHILHEQQFNTILNSPQLFYFLNLARNPLNNKINVYWFLQKIVNALEYQKNVELKQILIIEQQQQQTNTKPEISRNVDRIQRQYKDSIEQAEKQFFVQVNSLCSLGTQYFDRTIEKRLCLKMKKISGRMKKQKMTQWVNNEVYNIFKISTEFCNPILYYFVEEIFIRIDSINHTNSLILPRINDYLNILLNRIASEHGEHILQFVRYLASHSQFSDKYIDLIEMFCCQAFDHVLAKIQNKSTIKSFNLFLCLKKLYIKIGSSMCVSERWRIDMKAKIGLCIRKKMQKVLDIANIYEMDLLTNMLQMWNFYELEQQLQYQLLFKDEKVRKTMIKLLKKHSFSQILKSNSRNITQKCIISIILKTIIKFEQNSRIYSLIDKKQFAHIEKTGSNIYNTLLANQKNSYIGQDYCLQRKQCSPYYCNFSLITEYQKSILHLIFGIFILSRIYLAKNYCGSGNKTKKNENIIGHIRCYNNGRDTSFSFRLPKICKYQNTQTDQMIKQELQQIDKENISVILHPLSRLALADFKVLQLLQKVKPIQILIMHRSMVRRLMVIAQIVLIFYLYILTVRYHKLVNILAGVIFTLLNVCFLPLQIYYLQNKYKTLFPVKFSIIHPQTYSDNNKLSQIRLKWVRIKFTIVEVCKSLIILRILLICMSVLFITKPEYILLLFSFQILDLKIVRDCIKDLYKVIISLAFFLLVFIISLDFAILYIAWKELPQYNSLQKTFRSFMDIQFEILSFQNAYFNRPGQEEIKKISPLFQFIFFNLCISIVFATIHTIAESKKNREKFKQSCRICSKSREELRKEGESLEFHVEHIHRLWDYLFFLMEIDRKGDIQGLALGVRNRISKGDYSFFRQ